MRRLPLLAIPIGVLIAAGAAVLYLGFGVNPFSGGSPDPVVVSSTRETTPTATPTPPPTPSRTPSPTPEPSPPERYQHAIEARDRGELRLAASELALIADSSSPLAPFAAFRRAQVLIADGKYAAGVEAFVFALGRPTLPASLHPIARIEGAAALRELGDRDAAVDWLTIAITDPETSAGQAASARWERAQLALASDDPGWSDDATALIAQSPGHPATARALDALEAGAIEVPPLQAAYVRYLARENVRAVVRYQAILDDEPDATTAAVAWFYLGALAEREPDREAAIAAYGESIALDPAGSRADDAAYWRGRVAEEEADFDAAAGYYALLVTEYPNSSFASDGALRGALATFESGDEPTALEQLATIATGQGSQAPAAARWYDLIAGPDARVAAGVPAASEIDPRSFDAILEAAGSRALDAPLVEPLPRVVNSSSAITAWLTERYGVSTGTGQLGEDDTAELVQLLADAQERSLARAVLLERLDDVTSDPHAVIDTGIRAAALSLPDAGLIAAMRILGGMGSTARQGTPLELERIAYPAPWPELVVAASEEFGVPPLLLLALVRQESAFEPDVSSPAGAIGLTQVIPPTGVEIARILGEPWEGPVSLTDPATSLRYGAAYLATQLDAFDGNVFAALAAYNAGPGNAQRWLDVQVWPGADGYVQAIDFEETHRYVEGVVEQYAWYRYAYGLSTVPAIR